MAQRASKYVLEIAAQYTGDNQLRRLQQDLNAIGKIDSHNQAVSQWQTLNKQFVEAKQRARELRQELRQGGGADVQKQYAEVSREITRLGGALAGQRGKLAASARELRDAGIEASRTAEQYRKLQQSLQAGGRAAAARSVLGVRSDASIQREIAGLQNAYRDLARSGTASMAELNRAKTAMNARIAELTGATNRWRGSLLSANNLVRGMLAGLGIGMMARYANEVRRVADQYTQLDAKIRLTVNSEAEAAEVKKQLYENSQNTGTAFTANADAYAKLQMSLKEVGVSSRETVSMVDMINKSLVVNGSTTSMASAFQMQFAQAMGSGVLQGDEFRSMLENNGYFAAQLAKALGTNIAGLRQMSKAGELTSDVLRRAFPAMAAEIDKSFQQMPKKTDQAMQILRNTVESLINEGNKAGDGTGKIAASIIGLSATIEANREPLVNLITNLINMGASAVEVAARIGEFVAANSEMLAGVAKYGLIFGGSLKILTMFAGSLLQINTAVGVLTSARLAKWASGVAAEMVSLANKATLAGAAMRGFIAFAAAEGVVNIGRLGVEIYKTKKAWDEAHAAEKRAAEGAARLAEKYRQISEATGVTITSHQQLMQAVRDGKIHYDSATRSWVAGAAEKAAAEKTAASEIKKATGDALKEMRRQYQEYAKEIQRIQGDITGRQRSLTAELRDMARGGMSESKAWRDQKKEAEEYMAAAKQAAEEAQKAMAAGDSITAKSKFEEAVQYADDAKAAYKALNTEVKEGDQVVIAKADALKTAMDGVKKAGEIGIDVLKRQQQAAKKAMDTLVEKSGFADLTAGMDDVEKKWLENWHKMQAAAIKDIDAVEQRIVKMVNKDRTVYINVVERQKRSLGGLIGVARLATGGRLAGYGGGDRIPALLEAGEYVIRKEAVQRFGSGLFDALNNLRLPDMSALAAGGAGGRMVLELKLPGEGAVTATVSGDDAERLRRWNRRVSHLGARR